MVEIDLGSGRRKRGPVAIVRAFFENYDPEEDGTIRGWNVVVEWDAVRFNVGTIKLGFHSNAIDNDFRMKNPEGENVNASHWSRIGELGGKAGTIGRMIELGVNEASVTPGESIFEFVEVDAASQGHVYLTDYEFQYKMLSESTPIENADVDTAVRLFDEEK